MELALHAGRLSSRLSGRCWRTADGGRGNGGRARARVCGHRSTSAGAAGPGGLAAVAGRIVASGPVKVQAWAGCGTGGDGTGPLFQTAAPGGLPGRRTRPRAGRPLELVSAWTAAFGHAGAVRRISVKPTSGPAWVRRHRAYEEVVEAFLRLLRATVPRRRRRGRPGYEAGGEVEEIDRDLHLVRRCRGWPGESVAASQKTGQRHRLRPPPTNRPGTGGRARVLMSPDTLSRHPPHQSSPVHVRTSSSRQARLRCARRGGATPNMGSCSLASADRAEARPKSPAGQGRAAAEVQGPPAPTAERVGRIVPSGPAVALRPRLGVSSLGLIDAGLGHVVRGAPVSARPVAPPARTLLSLCLCCVPSWSPLNPT